MSKNSEIMREITPLSPEESFLVFDRVKKNFDFPLHYHPEVELNFIQKGKGVRRIVGDHVGEVGNIELVLIGPNLPHFWSDYRCKSKRIHEITVQFSADFFDQSFLKKRLLKPINDMYRESIRGILFSEEVAEKVKEPLMSLTKVSGFESFSLMMNILNELATSTNQTHLSSYSIDNETFVDEDDMNLIYDYLHSNFERKVTLDEIASHVNMSIVTFNRFIKKRTGKTFINYLNEIRVSYAARWLIEKDMSISGIAYKCGFNNIANFNKIFKTLKKCTPSEFRNQFTGIKKIE
ncbi:AraC family transcriptional regulator [Chryseobacterium sp. 6424]|uniref:AraC family transcriptional regulator n=1 Tax=Chryseobacterium sp. 6424 TaxID=2039166 RepID=UPI000EFAA089|nr:AraC family transcriptional regulator [Chryseobacterium sp. 6424]AYO56872.1 AraC family transcriptional regulator [Chryseobacterium sp. 6424]